MLAHNQIKRFDQVIVYASQIINHVELNYMTMEHEALAMVYALHKVLGLKLLWLFESQMKRVFWFTWKLDHLKRCKSKKNIYNFS